MNMSYWALGISITVAVTVIIAALTLTFRGGEWYGKVNSDRDTFKEFMKEIREKIDQILANLPKTPITPGSPLRLNELGEKVSEQTAASEWAIEQSEDLYEQTAGFDAMQIQEHAFSHAKSFEYPEEILSKMRASAFENGLKLDQIKDVLGIELRDALLRMHQFEQRDLD